MDKHFIKDTPHWKDHCTHGSSCFVGSGSYMDNFGGDFKEVFIDVYIYPSEVNKFDVCIRFGDEPSHYYSPGGLYDFVSHAGMASSLKVYREALDIMRDKGHLVFHPKGEEVTQEKVDAYLRAIKKWNDRPCLITARQLYERLTETHGIAGDEALDIISTAMLTALTDEHL